MAGNSIGGLKAAAANRERHGADFYSVIGRAGGRASGTGGFASKVVGKDGLTGKERARMVGAMGGSKSGRGKEVTPAVYRDIRDRWLVGYTPKMLSKRQGLAVSTVYRVLRSKSYADYKLSRRPRPESTLTKRQQDRLSKTMGVPFEAMPNAYTD